MLFSGKLISKSTLPSCGVVERPFYWFIFLLIFRFKGLCIQITQLLNVSEFGQSFGRNLWFHFQIAVVRKLRRNVLCNLSVERLPQKNFLGWQVIKTLNQMFGNVHIGAHVSSHAGVPPTCELEGVGIGSLLNPWLGAPQSGVEERPICLFFALDLKCQVVLHWFFVAF